jgi:hypothetical protein
VEGNRGLFQRSARVLLRHSRDVDKGTGEEVLICSSTPAIVGERLGRLLGGKQFHQAILAVLCLIRAWGVHGRELASTDPSHGPSDTLEARHPSLWRPRKSTAPYRQLYHTCRYVGRRPIPSSVDAGRQPSIGQACATESCDQGQIGSTPCRCGWHWLQDACRLCNTFLYMHGMVLTLSSHLRTSFLGLCYSDCYTNHSEGHLSDLPETCVDINSLHHECLREGQE